jgi:hypothetical protein
MLGISNYHSVTIDIKELVTGTSGAEGGQVLQKKSNNPAIQ